VSNDTPASALNVAINSFFILNFLKSITTVGLNAFRTLISWNRLIAGGVRDPLVGKDVLMGVSIAIVLALMKEIYLLSHANSGTPDLGVFRPEFTDRAIIGFGLRMISVRCLALTSPFGPSGDVPGRLSGRHHLSHQNHQSVSGVVAGARLFAM
jgi:hypothetical protein